MGRYGRAIYGEGKYGLDLRSEYTVEPMLATLEVDPVAEPLHVRRGMSSFTDTYGRAIYDRVQIAWLEPQGVDRFVLLRSNTGFPTGPTDPYAAALVDTASETLPDPVPIRRWAGDPLNRPRAAHVDSHVEQGREYYYAAWTMVGSEEDNTDEWFLAGRAMVTTSTDHNTLENLKSALPPYMWNRYNGPGSGVAVLAEPDDENTMTRWLQSTAWELDKILTKADLIRKIWDPEYTPAILLDDAISMFGLPDEPALGSRAARSLLTNAATITGERGTLNSISLLVESLSGFRCELALGTNLLPNTEESSFEGLMIDDDDNVFAGTGRWYIEGAKLSRIPGDPANANTKIARDPNSDEYVAPHMRFAIGLEHLHPTDGIRMSLGDRIRVSDITATDDHGIATTAWPHGMESGDEVTLQIPGTVEDYTVEITPIDDFNVKLKLPPQLDGHEGPITHGWFEGGPIPAFQGIPMDPKKPYSLVGMFRANDTIDVTLTMTYWDRFGNFLGTTVASPRDPVPTTGWTRVNSSGTSPEGASAATLTIEGDITAVDSIMVRQGGTRYDGVVDGVPTPFNSDMPYHGDVDYTFEDAQILILTFDTTHTPTGGKVPYTIRADMAEVLRSRLTDILTRYLPIGTGFRIEGLDT